MRGRRTSKAIQKIDIRKCGKEEPGRGREGPLIRGLLQPIGGTRINSSKTHLHLARLAEGRAPLPCSHSCGAVPRALPAHLHFHMHFRPALDQTMVRGRNGWRCATRERGIAKSAASTTPYLPKETRLVGRNSLLSDSTLGIKTHSTVVGCM